MIRRTLAALALALGLVVAHAAPAAAVTQNFGDTYGPNGSSLLTNAFDGFLQTHPGQWVGVCVTAKAAGGPEAIRVSTPYASVTVGNFGTGGFSTICASMYNYAPGYGPTTVRVVGAGGSAAWLRAVSIN